MRSALCALRIHAILSVIAFSAFFAAGVHAAEFSIRPGITVSEEYDDNIFLTPTDREDDFVTRVMPSILFKYKIDRWDLDLNYAYDYRYYDKRTRKDDTTHAADVKKIVIVLAPNGPLASKLGTMSTSISGMSPTRKMR